MWRNGQNRDGLRPVWWPASSLVKGEVLAGSVEGRGARTNTAWWRCTRSSSAWVRALGVPWAFVNRLGLGERGLALQQLRGEQVTDVVVRSFLTQSAGTLSSLSVAVDTHGLAGKMRAYVGEAGVAVKAVHRLRGGLRLRHPLLNAVLQLAEIGPGKASAILCRVVSSSTSRLRRGAAAIVPVEINHVVRQQGVYCTLQQEAQPS